MNGTSSNPRARILHLQRLSTDDGPGIRTTVFFKGCPMQCAWCHNPESISPYAQVQWLEHRCIGCGTCLGVCPEGALRRDQAGIEIDRGSCRGCGSCAEACPANALELLGTEIGVEELLREAEKDRAFYSTSQGGVTASGGEPLMQAGFLAAFFAGLREAVISTALDTCGLVSKQRLRRVLPHTDMIMFDLKEIDSAKHLAYTGQPNEPILETLLFVRDFIAAEAPTTRLWIRTPLIPGATLAPSNLHGLAAFIAQQGLAPILERWELCAFNNLCRDKYRRLGLNWSFDHTPLLAESDLRSAEQWARQPGIDPDIVVATGPTRPD